LKLRRSQALRAAMVVALVVALAFVPAVFTTYFTSAVAARALSSSGSPRSA
jgi:hypothetical protein